MWKKSQVGCYKQCATFQPKIIILCHDKSSDNNAYNMKYGLHKTIDEYNASPLYLQQLMRSKWPVRILHCFHNLNSRPQWEQAFRCRSKSNVEIHSVSLASPFIFNYSRPSVIRTLANPNIIFGNYNDIHWNFAVH